MPRVRFTRRCFEEDLQRLPRWAQKEALAAVRAIEANPETGAPLHPPLDQFRQIRIGHQFRLVYTYAFDSDIWWIYLIGERKPGKERDVYKILEQLIEGGLVLRERGP